MASQPSHIESRTFRHITRQEHQGRFMVRLPPGYRNDASSRWPLIVFLHGAGERGRDLNLVVRHGPLSDTAPPTVPAVVVAPQCESESWWHPGAVEALLRSCIERYRIDEARLYLTGISMGGTGTWETAAAYPTSWTAIAPICGRADPLRAPAFQHTPAYVVHGAQDAVIPPEQSRTMTDAINNAGGRAELTVHPGAGHDVWTQTYADPAFYDQLLQHEC